MPSTKRKFYLASLFVALIAGCWAVAAGATDDPAPLVTDRPDQTESAETVPDGTVQIELGWLRTEVDGRDGSTTTEVPGTLARIGLSDRFELRVGWAGQVDFESDVSPVLDASGTGDAELGGKYVLATENGRRPQIAVLGGLSIPVGEEELSSNRVDPAVRLSVSHTLSDRVGLGYNVGVEWATEEGASGSRTTLSSYLYTVAAGFGLTDKWGAFAEVFGTLSGSAPGEEHSVNGGVTFLVHPRFQLDLAVGTGLSDEAADFFVGFGASFRLPR